MPRSSTPKNQAFLVIPSTGTVVNLTMQQAQPFLEGGVTKTEAATKALPASKAASPKTNAKAASKPGVTSTKAAKPAKATKATKAVASSEPLASATAKTTAAKAKPIKAAKATKSAEAIEKPAKATKAAKSAQSKVEAIPAGKSSASMQDVREAAKRVILRHGRPMPRRELFKTLTSGRNGLAIAGRDPVENMATMLYKDRDKSFENLKGQGFWIKGEPLPASDESASQS